MGKIRDCIRKVIGEKERDFERMKPKTELPPELKRKRKIAEKRRNSKEIEIMDIKIIIFLIGVAILGSIGGSIIPQFTLIGELAFVLLIVFLIYVLFKKLFLK